MPLINGGKGSKNGRSSAAAAAAAVAEVGGKGNNGSLEVNNNGSNTTLTHFTPIGQTKV